MCPRVHVLGVNAGKSLATSQQELIGGIRLTSGAIQHWRGRA